MFGKGISKLAKIFCVLIYLLPSVVSDSVAAEEPAEVEWVRTWGSAESRIDSGQAVAVDYAGNTYVVGSFVEMIDFDPEDDIDPLHSNGGLDAYICKFDANGEFLWGRAWGGSEWDTAIEVALSKDGEPFVTGSFSETVDFDPGSDTDIRTSQGGRDAYVVKFNSNGEYQWVRTWGGSGMDRGTALEIDDSVNLYVTGQFQEQVDFRPGQEIDEHTAEGVWNAFLLKLDDRGEFKWVCTWGGAGTASAWSIALDNNENPYVVGKFNHTADFDPSQGIDMHSAVDEADAFLTRFDTLGNLTWARTWGGAGYDSADGVTIDNDGNVYVQGAFQEAVDFDPGPDVVEREAAGIRDAFLTKFNPDGDLVWNVTRGLTGDYFGYDWLRGIAYSPPGSIFISGRYYGTVIFDPDSDTGKLISQGEWDAYMCEYNTDGDLIRTRTWGGTETDYCNDLAVDQNGLYVTGGFRSQGYYGLAQEDDFYSEGIYEAFLIKFVI